MAVTLIYLPMDSDIPMAVRTREPFAMTFPIEAAEGMTQAQARVIEATPGRGDERPRRRCAASSGCMLSSTACARSTR